MAFGFTDSESGDIAETIVPGAARTQNFFIHALTLFACLALVSGVIGGVYLYIFITEP